MTWLIGHHRRRGDKRKEEEEEGRQGRRGRGKAKDDLAFFLSNKALSCRLGAKTASCIIDGNEVRSARRVCGPRQRQRAARGQNKESRLKFLHRTTQSPKEQRAGSLLQRSMGTAVLMKWERRSRHVRLLRSGWTMGCWGSSFDGFGRENASRVAHAVGIDGEML
eukprot:1606183-Rhodomonas_salina.1